MSAITVSAVVAVGEHHERPAAVREDLEMCLPASVGAVVPQPPRPVAQAFDSQPEAILPVRGWCGAPSPSRSARASGPPRSAPCRPPSSKPPRPPARRTGSAPSGSQRHRGRWPRRAAQTPTCCTQSPCAPLPRDARPGVRRLANMPCRSPVPPPAARACSRRPSSASRARARRRAAPCLPPRRPRATPPSRAAVTLDANPDSHRR